MSLPARSGAIERLHLACPVCGGGEAVVWVEHADLSFVQCRGCAVVYKRRELESLRPADYYEAAYFHGRRSGRDRRFGHRVGKSMRHLRLALELGSPRSLLDVGCSLGYVIEAGNRLGLESAGTDISKYAVEVCRQRGYSAEVGTLTALPYPDARFDLVVMKHVLEHTPEPRVALAEVHRITTPGALVMVVVPHLRYWRADVQRRTYRYFRADDLGAQHYVYYTEETLGRVLRACGFEPILSEKSIRRAGLWGALRHGVVSLGHRVAAALRMRREVFVIARRIG